ncbi:alpha/beta fold hydrolase, partial [Rhizobium ruizarguesonis]
IWGEKDLYITSEIGIEFAGKIGAKLDVLPGIGHFPHQITFTGVFSRVRLASRWC